MGWTRVDVTHTEMGLETGKLAHGHVSSSDLDENNEVISIYDGGGS
jgi:hypothetical protein